VRADASIGTGQRSRWRSVLASVVAADYPDLAERHRAARAYDTEPQERDLEITGHPVVHLHVRADAPDANVFVYLEDVAPDGRVNYITEGDLRALHRRVVDPPGDYRSQVPYRSFRRADAAPLAPGEPTLLTVPLLPTSYRLARGHRLRMVITAADADHFAPPPAGLRGFELLRSEAHPSRLELPVIDI
jgi:hypothetical protein